MFPLLLSFIIFTVYKVICDPIILCDNGSSPLLLDQLQQNLAAEMEKSHRISNDIIEYKKTMEEITENYELTIAQRLDSDRINKELKKMLFKSLDKCDEIEASIKKINPNFRPGLQYANAQRIREIERTTRR